jgi:hypothetical protein
MVAGKKTVSTKEMIVERHITSKEAIKPDEVLLKTRKK